MNMNALSMTNTEGVLIAVLTTAALAAYHVTRTPELLKPLGKWMEARAAALEAARAAYKASWEQHYPAQPATTTPALAHVSMSMYVDAPSTSRLMQSSAAAARVARVNGTE